MQLRRLVFGLLFALFATAIPGLARAAEVVTLGTAAPKQSLWGNVFKVWEEAVKKKTDGKLELQVFYNGSQGDDATMIGKLKSGQLDGAAVSSVGLSQIYKPILALQIPGLFTDWESLDKAREAVRADLEAGANKAGFIVGFGDLGKMRTFTIGFAVRRPDDLQGKKVLTWRSDVIGPTFYQVIPKGPTLVPMSVSEVLPALRTKTVDVVGAPTLAAEQLQWTQHFDHISKASMVMAIGGIAWSKKRIDSLPGDLRQVLVDTGAIVQSTLRKKVRAEDDAAFDRLSQKMTVVELADGDRASWKPIFESAISRLKQGTFDAQLVDQLIALSKK